MGDRALAAALLAVSTALDAGLGIERVLGDPALQATFPSGFAPPIAASLRRGAHVADAFAETGLFRRHELALIAAGERGGMLPEALAQLAASVEDRDRTRRKLMASLAYPALLVLAAGLILPLPLLVTDGLGAYAKRAVWLPLAVVLVALLFGVLLPGLPATDPRRAWPRRVLRMVPGVSRIVRRNDVGLFLQVLGDAIRAGIGVVEALDTAGQAVEDPKVRRMASDARTAIRGGAGLTEALGEARVLRADLLALLAQAEVTGTLDASLSRAAAMEKEAARVATRRALAMLVAVIYGAIVIAIGWSIIRGFIGVLDAIDTAVTL